MERRRRVQVFLVVVVATTAFLGVQALTTGETRPLPSDGDGTYPGHTLVSIQSFDGFRPDNGEVRLVDPSGEVVWEYDPPNAWVFDAELTRAGTVLVSLGESAQAPGVECPDRYGGTPTAGTPDPFTCVRNRVVEIDFRTKETVWEYAWYDAFPPHHEVHDADRLPSGETAIIDMGNNRAFTVDRSGTITWQWNASDHIAAGTDFWERYVPMEGREEFRQGPPESDWTHMNDIDRLQNGNFQLSIRNFDVVLEVDPETNAIVDVIGQPDNHTLMNEQHNPMRVTGAGTIIIADSSHGGPTGADRIVELDVETEEIVWTYDGTGSGKLLQWPRDADRLPNGNTLITDSRNSRVIEINENGSVVWRYSIAEENAIVYEADRVSHPSASTYIPEEYGRVPSGRNLESRTSSDLLATVIAVVESWSGLYLPHWIGAPELLAILTGGLGVVGLAVEGYRAR